jgi:hypothetical protein
MTQPNPTDSEIKTQLEANDKHTYTQDSDSHVAYNQRVPTQTIGRIPRAGVPDEHRADHKLSVYGQQSASEVHVYSDQLFDCRSVSAEREDEFRSEGVVPSYARATRATI